MSIDIKRHQKIELEELTISFCSCQQGVIQVIDKKNKIITPMSIKGFLYKINKKQ